MHKFQKETFRKKKRDIIEEYLDYSSPVHAPPPHMGRIPAVLSNKSSPSTCSPYLRTLEGIKKFETWLDEKGIRLVEIKLPEEKKTTAHIKFEKLLNELCNEISQSHVKPPHLKKLGIQEQPTFSMDQPTVLSDVTEQHHATIIMQKALRGRSSQRKMLLEKERYKDLIEECHGLHAISIEEKEAIDKKLELRNKLIRDKEYRNKKVRQFKILL
ncbi:cilia- and flagella-associated protein 91-like [Centruroides vittatus]|uniref:cilia- and flagella-associated protein 91-like n=1 Tax=Centruroides vittatus TaxID=120091 RepID=UPI00350EB5E2